MPTDVTRWEDNEALVAAALARFGRLDVAYANAGFGGARGWLESTPEHWREMVLTNVLGAAYTARAAIPALKETRGHLLLTGSVAGRRAVPGSLYSVTKWAVTAMGEAIRADLGDSGVRTTLIEPGRSTRRSSTIRARAGSRRTTSRAPCMYAVSQPPHVDVNEILIRPVSQET